MTEKLKLERKERTPFIYASDAKGTDHSDEDTSYAFKIVKNVQCLKEFGKSCRIVTDSASDDLNEISLDELVEETHTLLEDDELKESPIEQLTDAEVLNERYIASLCDQFKLKLLPLFDFLLERNGGSSEKTYEEVRDKILLFDLLGEKL